MTLFTAAGVLRPWFRLPDMLGNRGLGNLGPDLARALAETALRLFSKGDVRAAWSKASGALERDPKGDFRKQLGIVFYSHGKLLTSEGMIQKAVRDFQTAADCDGRNELFRNRLRVARRALEHSRRWGGTDFLRRKRVIEFCHDMKATKTGSIEDLPQQAVWHYVSQAGYIHPPSPEAKLPSAMDLDEFHALGTYRWRGDVKAYDDFSVWVRRMKTGENTVARHLGGLLADWISSPSSKTDCARDADFLVAVPGAPQRENERRLNPPEELAKELEKILGIPLLSNVLRRDNAPRSRETPYEVLRRSYKLGKNAIQVKDRWVLLADDVATKGHTLRACSELLRDAGAKRVVCVVLAQAVSTLREERAAAARNASTT